MSTRPPLPAHRARRGWSQAQLAEQAGVSRTEISAIETGRVVPSVLVALRLAAVLGEPVEALFGSAPATAPRWAWPPAGADRRLWQATVGGTIVAYPVEPTAAGSLPHDARADHDVPELAPGTRPDRTLVIAGCDPLVTFLVREMAERHDVRVLPLLRSSAEALDLLRRGLVHVAGVHLTNDDESSANDEQVRRQLGGGHCLLHQVRWDTGIAVGRHRRERRASDLLRTGVRWVNREEGSAARQALDRLLARRPRKPSGYAHVVRDHRSVAATIASGWAEAGICIRATAVEAHLHFLPLHRDAYELCLHESLLDDPRVIALTAALGSRRYRQWLAEVPGCVSSDTGAQRMIG